MDGIFMIILCILFVYQQFFLVKIQAKEICYYRDTNFTTIPITCDDDCCSAIASSIQTACCNHISWSSLAIPIFIVGGICILSICLLYCRPLWKACLCGCKWPCRNRTQVASPATMGVNNNPVYVVNNDDLPDYETISKDAPMKDVTPPPYTFVAAHPNDYGFEARVPSAPPQYQSRRGSLSVTDSNLPVVA